MRGRVKVARRRDVHAEYGGQGSEDNRAFELWRSRVRGSGSKSMVRVKRMSSCRVTYKTYVAYRHRRNAEPIPLSFRLTVTVVVDCSTLVAPGVLVQHSYSRLSPHRPGAANERSVYRNNAGRARITRRYTSLAALTYVSEQCEADVRGITQCYSSSRVQCPATPASSFRSR